MVWSTRWSRSNELALAISRITNPHVQENVADIFGMREALPMVRQGPDAIERLKNKRGRARRRTEGDAQDAPFTTARDRRRSLDRKRRAGPT